MNKFGVLVLTLALALGSSAAALSPGVYVDQITETGLNAELTVVGTRFFVDPNLHRARPSAMVKPRTR